MNRFQRFVCVGFIILILLSSGCVQMIQVEEGTEGVLYHLSHPHPTTQEITHE